MRQHGKLRYRTIRWSRPGLSLCPFCSSVCFLRRNFSIIIRAARIDSASLSSLCPFPPPALNLQPRPSPARQSTAGNVARASAFSRDAKIDKRPRVCVCVGVCVCIYLATTFGFRANEIHVRRRLIDVPMTECRWPFSGYRRRSFDRFVHPREIFGLSGNSASPKFCRVVLAEIWMTLYEILGLFIEGWLFFRWSTTAEKTAKSNA